MPSLAYIFRLESRKMMKSIRIIAKLILLFSVGGFLLIYLFAVRNNDTRMVAGYKYEYSDYKRRLTVDDFQQFGYETIYSEVVETVGEENGEIGENYFYPYYELCDGTYVIIYFNYWGGSIAGISVADKKEILYSLLPRKVPCKNEEERERELLCAKQYEMNIIMELLGMEKWEKPEVLGNLDDPMGAYSEETLKRYTDMDLYIEIDYKFEDYEDSNDEPLFQSIIIYQNGKQCGAALVAWNCCYVIDSELIQ